MRNAPPPGDERNGARIVATSTIVLASFNPACYRNGGPATVTDANGSVLGTGNVNLPTDGWWVLGLGPKDASPPPVDPPPVNNPPPPVDPPPPPVNPPPPLTPPPPSGGGSGSGSGGGPVATPEPSTLVLLGIGGATAGLWRKRVRREAV